MEVIENFFISLFVFLSGCQSEEKTNEFLLACKYENISVIESMIVDKIDINAKNNKGITALMVAAAENRPDVVKLLLKEGAEPNIKSRLGISALMFAAARGSDIEIIQALIDAKSNVNWATLDSDTVIMMAISRGEQIRDGYLPIIELRKPGSELSQETQFDEILSAVADRAKAKGQNTVLMTETQALSFAPGFKKNNHKQIIEALLLAGADVNACNKLGESVFYQAVNEDLSVDIIKMLINAGADINKADNDGTTPVMLATVSNNVDLLTSVYSDKLNIDQENNEGVNALQIAASYSNPEVITALIKAGADVNYISKHQITPLMLAAINQKLDNMKVLIENGANINEVDAHGVSAIGYSHDDESRQYLLDNNALLDNQIAKMATNDLYDCASKVNDSISLMGLSVKHEPFQIDERYGREKCKSLGEVTFSLGKMSFNQTEDKFLGKSIKCELINNQFNCVEVP